MVVRSGDAEICTQAFGREADPPVLLVMGMMASMLWWPDGFCERLAARGLRVIRYDNRDTGLSTSYEPGAPPYSGQAFIDDAIAVLDAYGAGRAHVVGLSMGGGIAQEIALLHPDRVATLTLISTSPITGRHELPGPDPAYLEHMESLHADWEDQDSIAAMLLSDMRALSSTRHPFDEAATRAAIERDLARTRRPASLQNHQLVEGPETPQGEITAPLLVIHGTADPMFPIAHGEAFGAPLVRVEGGGHEINPGDWEQIIDAIAHHATPDQSPGMEYRYELTVIPVGDVERAKAFYADTLGWEVDTDFAPSDSFRVVQVTPPGSAASISFGTGLSSAPPGSFAGMHLIVDDIEAAKADLDERGVDAGEPFHFGETGQTPGLHPQRAAYGSYLSFRDPDGNTWLVQEVKR